jgi:transporter family-2 protein
MTTAWQPIDRAYSPAPKDRAKRSPCMKTITLPIAFVAGTFNAIEAGTNTALRKGLGAPFLTLAVISAMTLAFSLTSALFAQEPIPNPAELASVPWWGWFGGLLGFGFVAAMIYTADTLGSALFIGLTVTASTLLSVALDHFGWLGFTQHLAGPGRLIGALLMVIGVGLIAAF